MIKLNITSHPVGTKILVDKSSEPGFTEVEIQGWTIDSRFIKLEGKWKVASLVDCVGIVATEPKWKIRKDLDTTPYIPYIPYSPPYCPRLPYTYPQWDWTATDIKLCDPILAPLNFKTDSNTRNCSRDPTLGKGTTY